MILIAIAFGILSYYAYHKLTARPLVVEEVVPAEIILKPESKLLDTGK